MFHEGKIIQKARGVCFCKCGCVWLFSYLYVLDVFLNWSLSDSYGFRCLSHIQWTTLRFSVEALFMAWFLQVGLFFSCSFVSLFSSWADAFKKGRSVHFSLSLISIDWMPSRKRIFSPIIFLHHHIETTILLRYKQNQFAKTFCANISISSGAFKAKDEIESDEIFKSVGIDKEGGLVFTLDTLQANNCFKTLVLNKIDLFFTLDMYRPHK